MSLEEHTMVIMSGSTGRIGLRALQAQKEDAEVNLRR